MNTNLTAKQLFFLLLMIGGVIFVPYIAVYIAYGGQIPDTYFNYPPIHARPKPEFHLGIFLSFVGVGVLIFLLYFFPRVYGFKKVTARNSIVLQLVKPPIWFWIGALMFIPTLVLLTLQVPEPRWLIKWALLPLFWGFTLILDGIVYSISNGDSMINKKPSELIAIGVASMSGWMLFDFLNFFIDRNWFYPKAELVNTRNYEFVIYAFLGSSGFFPMAFEWYFLLRKIRILNVKYSDGPKIKTPRWLLWGFIAICMYGLYITPGSQDKYFYILWLAPVIILTSSLTLVRVWTPFTPIAQGNWTALLTFSLTYFIQGFLLEMWNYMSADHIDGTLYTWNAAYWQYCLPFVHVFPIFEMPVVGYLGYFFFSIHCYVWWLLAARLMGVQNDYGDAPIFK